MLYYILPPFIIILSAGALIVFLFRKMENVSVEQLVVENVKQQQAFKKIDALKSLLSQWGLGLLEKMMHRAKLLALKFHNASNELFHSIKEKRERRMKTDQERKKQTPEVLQPSTEILQTLEDDRPRVKEMVLPSNYVPAKEISTVASSSPKTRVKAKLEEVLIKRIAVNPRDIEAYERLGDYYLERENHSDSLECFRQVLKLSPAHHKAKTRIRKLESMLK
ncbi:MAG: hypothetical protein WCJ51_01685 [Candidatus Moraniibacteriota bacterium]